MSGETVKTGVSTTPINNQAYLTQLYANSVGSSLDNDIGSSYFGNSFMNPLGINSDPLSMNGSVFPFSGAGFGSYGSKQWERYYNAEIPAIEQLKDGEKYTDARRKIDVAAYEKESNATFQVSSPDAIIKEQAEVLRRKIENNEQEHVYEEYERLLNVIKDKYPQTNENDDFYMERIKAQADDVYKSTNNGVGIIKDLKEHGEDKFVQGLRNGTGIGLLFDHGGKNCDDTIADITGEKVSQDNKIKQGIGTALGAIGTAVVTLLALPLIIRGGRRAFKAIGKSYTALWSPILTRAGKI